MNNFKDFLESKKDLLTNDVIEKIENDFSNLLDIFKLKQFEVESIEDIDNKKKLLLFFENGFVNFKKELFPYFNQPNLEYNYKDFDGALIYVHFYYLYRNQYEKLNNEILSKSNQSIDIELSDYSNSTIKEKVIALKELGILDFLQQEFQICQTSTNKLSEVLSLLTGEKASTIQSYINPMNDITHKQHNNPYSNTKTVEKTKDKLINIGISSLK